MNASGNFSRGLFDFSPLRFYFEFEFSSAQPLVLIFQETRALKDGVLSLVEHSKNRSLGLQCLDTLPQSLTQAFGFTLESKIRSERLQVPLQPRVYGRPNLHGPQVLYQQKLTDGN